MERVNIGANILLLGICCTIRVCNKKYNHFLFFGSTMQPASNNSTLAYLDDILGSYPTKRAQLQIHSEARHLAGIHSSTQTDAISVSSRGSQMDLNQKSVGLSVAPQMANKGETADTSPLICRDIYSLFCRATEELESKHQLALEKLEGLDDRLNSLLSQVKRRPRKSNTQLRQLAEEAAYTSLVFNESHSRSALVICESDSRVAMLAEKNVASALWCKKNHTLSSSSSDSLDDLLSECREALRIPD